MPSLTFLDEADTQLKDYAHRLCESFMAKASLVMHDLPGSPAKVKLPVKVDLVCRSASWTVLWSLTRRSLPEETLTSLEANTFHVSRGVSTKYPLRCFKFCPKPIYELALAYEEKFASIRTLALEIQRLRRKIKRHLPNLEEVVAE